jgi:hypothetical protein
MLSTELKISSKTEDKKVRISKKISDGENSKELEVTEVENGFIIEITTSGYKGEGEKKEHFYECKKWISETNPLEKLTAEKKEEKKSKSLVDVINEINIL